MRRLLENHGLCSIHGGSLLVVLLAYLFMPRATAYDDEVRRQWILVTTPQFIKPATPLLERRRSQGWNVSVIDASALPATELEQTLQTSLARRDSESQSSILILGAWDEGLASRPGRRASWQQRQNEGQNDGSRLRPAAERRRCYGCRRQTSCTFRRGSACDDHEAAGV